MDDFYSLQLDKLERFVCLKESEVVPDLADPNADDSDENDSEGSDESGDDDDEDDEIDDEMGDEEMAAGSRQEDDEDESVSRGLPPWIECVSKRHLIGRGAGRNEEEGTSIPLRDENATTACKGEIR